MSEQQRIVAGGCYQPSDPKKLRIKLPDPPKPPAHKPGWVNAILWWIERKIALIGRAVLACFRFSMGLFLAYGLWRIQTTRDMAKEARAEEERAGRSQSN